MAWLLTACLASLMAFAMATVMNEEILKSSMTPPKNFAQLECAVNQFAEVFASKRVPASSLHYIHDALNIEQICPGSKPISEHIARLKETIGAYEPHPQTVAVQEAISNALRNHADPAATPSYTFIVATNGKDTNPGTVDQPFGTLARAQQATRAVRCTPCVVLVREGKYFMTDLGGTLKLTPADSNVIYSSYNSEKVTLSGASHLSSLDWSPYPAIPGVYQAQFAYKDERADAWRAAQGLKRGVDKVAGPPPIVADLFVNGIRQVRARYPNGNPQDNSGLCFSATQRPGEGCTSYSSCATGSSGNFPAPSGQSIKNIGPNRGVSPHFGCVQCTTYGEFEYTIYPPPSNHPVYNKPLPSSGWTNSSVWDYWGSLFSRPADVIVDPKCDSKWNTLNLSKATDAVVHMFHPGLWGGWAFAVDDIVDGLQGKKVIKFGYGGYQEARGGNVHGGQHFYLENMLALLDVPGEWFYDYSDYNLYYYPNTTEALSNLEFSIPTLDSVFTIQGADSFTGSPALNITINGFTITETKYTYLEQYEVPSGGDWSIHRGGAIFVENAENVVITMNTFNQTGGNAVFVSNHVKNSAITDNEFIFIGDSAIALQGSAVRNDGSAPTFPVSNTIAQNHIHEIGLFGKQTSCIYLSLVGNNTIVDNICYNGPRAHINSNDGFAGGNILQGNLLFNGVRETGDHGNYNSWDRQPYWTLNGVNDGFGDKRGRSYIKAIDLITKNFIINGYNGVWTIDHDDGSQFFLDLYNALYFGGCKNYLGNSKSCSHNVITYPGVDQRSAGNRRCQTDDNGVFANQFHQNNTCYVSDGVFYSFSNCDVNHNLNMTVYKTGDNKLFTDAGTSFDLNCPKDISFPVWQSYGQDPRSSVATTPSVDDIIKAGMNVLGL